MTAAGEPAASPTGLLTMILLIVFRIAAICFTVYSAYHIRMHAINTFGLVIHEFDPWFNFRATQYLADNGLEKFFHWYDYMSWSPLGRPVGTTIYPGMQMAAVFIWRIINQSGHVMSLNDVCCYVPVWFGVFASLVLGALTWVASGSLNSGVIASCVMAIIPAHLMRSVGGGYDNESVAISALCLTFFFWMYSLSGKDDKKGSIVGIFTGLAYVCMVAAWGGYIFVLNLIGLHGFLLILMGRFSNKLYWAYSLWYVIGTFGATRIPVVGMAPLKSLEQLAPAGVFVLMQLLQLCENPAFLKFLKLDPKNVTPSQRFKVRTQVFGAAAVVASVIIAALWPTGYFGPLSSRVRGLFVTHTRTGNPLVDSVAEHQPANPQAFWQFLHYTCHSAPIGFFVALYSGVIKPYLYPRKEGESSTDPMVFVVVWGMVTYHFSTKMNRLMLLMGPISAVLTGIAIESLTVFIIKEFSAFYSNYVSNKTQKKSADDASPASASASSKESKGQAKKRGTEKSSVPKKSGSNKSSSSANSVLELLEEKLNEVNSLSMVQYLRLGAAVIVIYLASIEVPAFYRYAFEMSSHLSHPSLMFQARLGDGSVIMVDDYREAYWWLRDTTPEDARVMAWWDYGYQITGIGNRTTIADGNTWNHEVWQLPPPSSPPSSPHSSFLPLLPSRLSSLCYLVSTVAHCSARTVLDLS
jgi:dolichyl-diphosphooligosaccharide---protein glycosyltransferase